MQNTYRVGVIGGGAWGTALGIIANRAGSDVILGTRNANVIQSITERRTNDIYLPNVFIDPNITISDQIADTCKGDVLILALNTDDSVSMALSVALLTNARTTYFPSADRQAVDRSNVV